jgi:hypothetical protein
MFGVPWPMPWAHTLFKIGDDLVGDSAVNIRVSLMSLSPSPELAKQRRCFLPVGETGVCKWQGGSQEPETQQN